MTSSAIPPPALLANKTTLFARIRVLKVEDEEEAFLFPKERYVPTS